MQKVSLYSVINIIDTTYMFSLLRFTNKYDVGVFWHPLIWHSTSGMT